MDWKNRRKPDWPPRPRGLTEKGYRKYMSTQGTDRIGGVDYTFQSISPDAYLDNYDRYNKKNTKKYADWLFKNVVISPSAIAVDGMDHFKDDTGGALALLEAIENFLGKPKEQGDSKGKSTTTA